MILGQHSKIAATGSDISAQVEIGNYTSIAPYVQMHSIHNHACIQNRALVSTFQLPTYPDPVGRDKIVIGSDVWVGRNVVILGGVTIGHGAIIGAFSVIAKDVSPYAVVVGNPAIVKRYRFTPTQIDHLLKIKWWDWSEEEMSERQHELLDIGNFG